jgi:1-acyl-sn-glycerol-3-phosphate acyltransferase
MAGYRPSFYRFIRWLVKRFYFGTRGGLFTVGEQNMPSSGGVILAPNHVSHLDPPAACCALRRPVHCMAKEELFKYWWSNWLLRALAAFPVKRGEGDTEAIRKAIELVEKGNVVLLFPEGTRSDGETMLPFNRGVAMLAKKTGAPVVPVAITGTEKVMPSRGVRKPQKARMTVAAGTPFTYAETATGANEKQNRELFIHELETRILALCDEHGLKLQRAQPGVLAPTRD